MPVKLRLRRQGRSKAPHYAIVAADARAPRDGRIIEKLGFYNPVTSPGQVYVDHEAALKWLKTGAQPTNTVRSLLRHAGVTVKFALFKQGKSEEEAEKIFNRWWEERQARKKKKIVAIDIHGNLLEDPGEIPIPKQFAKAAAEEAATPAVEETPAPAPVEAEAAPTEEEAPAEE